MSNTATLSRAALSGHAARLLGRWLTQTFPVPALLDLSFPQAVLAAAMPGSLVGIADPDAMPAARRKFWERFRPAGGRSALFDTTEPDILPEALWNKPGAQRIVHADTPLAPGLLENLLRLLPSPIFLGEGVSALRLEGFETLTLQIMLGGWTGDTVMLAPAARMSEIASSLISSAGQLGFVTAEEGLMRLEADPPFADPHAPLLAEIPAATLIHDGDYRSEADGSYTWLWSGPDRHFRMALGSLPPLSRWMKIAIIGVPEAAVLDNMAVSLNGERVAHRLERWSETSAGIVLDLPTDLPPDLVIGLAARRVVQEKDGERRLGFCVHKIEVFS